VLLFGVRPGLLLDLAENADVDVETPDTLVELATELAGEGVALPAGVGSLSRSRAAPMPRLVPGLRVEPTLETALRGDAANQ
jgi:hypothetical protein